MLRGFLSRIAVGIAADLILQVLRDLGQRAGQAKKQLCIALPMKWRSLVLFSGQSEWQKR